MGHNSDGPRKGLRGIICIVYLEGVINEREGDLGTPIANMILDCPVVGYNLNSFDIVLTT